VGSADRIIDMTLFDSTLQASMHTAIGTQLTPGGGTPMLFGLEEADNMMSGMDCRAIVLLSDGGSCQRTMLQRTIALFLSMPERLHHRLRGARTPVWARM